MKNAILEQIKRIFTKGSYPTVRIPMSQWEWGYDSNGEVKYNNFKTLVNHVNYRIQSKLDKFIVKLFGKPAVMQPEPPEPSVNEVINYFIESIENNKKTLIIMFIILSALKVLEKSL